MREDLFGTVTVRPQAEGRAVSVDVDLELRIDAWRGDEIEDADWHWSWLIVADVGDRRFTAGCDSEIETHQHPDEIAGELRQAWLRRDRVGHTLRLQAGVHVRGEWNAWAGELKLALGETDFSLQPCAAFDGVPWTAPASGRIEDHRKFNDPIVMPGHGALVCRAPSHTGPDYELVRPGGSRQTLAVPRAYARWTGELEQAVCTADGRVALFRSFRHPAPHGCVATIFPIDAPERAFHVHATSPIGGCDASSQRIWVTRESAIALVGADGSVREHATRGGQVYEVSGGHVFMRRGTALERVPLDGGPAEKLSDAPLEDFGAYRFLAETRTLAWTWLVSDNETQGTRCTVRWLDLATFEGGEALVADRVEVAELLPSGEILAAGAHAWCVGPAREPRLLERDAKWSTYERSRVAGDRYWCSTGEVIALR